MEQIPLFPLNTVLFPGARLPLRIFEQRYLELVKDCLKQQRDFAIVQIQKGQETGVVPQIHAVGTTARIVDWNQLEGGILGIVVEGGERVHIRSAEGAIGEVMQGNVDTLSDQALLEQTQDIEFVSLLKRLQQHPMVETLGMVVDYEDLTAVTWALASLLPVDLHKKQYLLELDSAQLRYDAIHDLLQMLEG